MSVHDSLYTQDVGLDNVALKFLRDVARVRTHFAYVRESVLAVRLQPHDGTSQCGAVITVTSAS